MFKKLIYLISFALVLCLFQTSIANAADPSLVGWWKFDEGSGTVAADSSGHGINGTLVSDPVWRQDGVHKGCLFFDGAQSHVRVPNQASLNPGDWICLLSQGFPCMSCKSMPGTDTIHPATRQT